MNYLEKLQAMDPVIVALVFMTALVVGVVWSWHANKSNDFHLQQVLVDSVTGKIAIEKVGFMTALAVGTWGFTALIIKGQMTEWYAGIYIGAFVAGRLGSSWLSVKKEIFNQPEPPK